MIVALKVHPFIITLGTMTIYRGVAFVITTGQSVGTFPTAYPELVKWEAFGGLRLVPLLVMILVTMIGTVYLARLAAGPPGQALARHQRRALHASLFLMAGGRALVGGGRRLLCAGQGPALEAALHGADLSADAGGVELFPRQWLQEPSRRKAMCFSEIGRSTVRTYQKTSFPFPVIACKFFKIVMAWRDRGARWGRRIFVQLAGIVHTAASRSNSCVGVYPIGKG